MCFVTWAVCVQKAPEGLSGSLTFNQDGSRKDYTLHVYSMALDRGIRKVGGGGGGGKKSFGLWW